MSHLKNPLFSLDGRGTLSKAITFVKRRGQNIAEKKPEIIDAKSTAQLSWRHMYQKCAALWQTLSVAERAEWESVARPKHMTGYAYWQSQCLRPNPGIYLPLQGGTMQGIIDMDGFAIQDILNPVAPQDADTEAARDAAIAAAIGGSLHCDIHGYDGANWQKLLTESAAFHNLRVKLYDGANAIATSLPEANLTTERGLVAVSTVQVRTAFNTFFHVSGGLTAADNHATTGIALDAKALLYGFDGSAWDRLRSYETGILKVAKGAIHPTRVRMTATGRVGVAGPKTLFWIACSPDTAAAEWEISDSDAAGAAIEYDHFDSDKHSEQIPFDPPMEFATGIWLEKFDHMKSLVFCYK